MLLIIIIILLATLSLVPLTHGSLPFASQYLAETQNKGLHLMTASGLLYRNVEGTNDEAHKDKGVYAKVSDAVVSVKYSGSYVRDDGQEMQFATSGTSNHVFIASDLIQGWQEGVHLMTVGDSYEFIIPPALGYGAGGAGGGAIPGHAVLVFRLELNGYDEIGDEFIDKTIWRVIVTCRRKIYKGVELWQMALLWFVLSSLPMFNKKSAPKKDAGGRQLYAIMHHILTKNLKDCDRAMRELKGGRTFADVAKERSVCESKSGNGYLGSYETGTAIDAFEKVMWKVRIGNVVGPIQSEFGWHLLLVSSRGLREAKVEKEKEGKKTQ